MGDKFIFKTGPGVGIGRIIKLGILSFVMFNIIAGGDTVVAKEAKIPHPIQIVLSDEEHNFELDEIVLEEVLLQEDIKDLPVAVVSGAGAFRKRKSFILDFFLRYSGFGVSSS